MQKKTSVTVSEIIKSFWTHLDLTCGASSNTCKSYTKHTRRFLIWKFRDKEVDPSIIKVADLMVYISQFAACHKPRTSKSMTTSLRSFLCFLQLKGHSTEQLVNAIPVISARGNSHLPVSLSEAQLQQLLGSFNLATPYGVRDLAIVQCLVGLGLRAGEAAELTLDDIEWRRGVVRICKSKGRRVNWLPLPKIVGQSIVNYLSKGRPPTHQRRLFVRHSLPYAAIDSRTVQTIVGRAIERAKLDIASKGSHVLRHTLGTRLIQAGVSIKEIADVLGHQHINTTMIYTHVDLPLLSEVALPWPEVKL